MPTHAQVIQLAAAEADLRAGRLQEAECALQKLLRKDERLLAAHEMLGFIAVRRQHFEDAVACHERCLKLRPQSGKYALLIAKAYTGLGRLEEALTWYDRALELDPGSTEAIAWKALALERARRPEEALALVAPFLERGDESTDMAKAYIHAMQRGRQHDEAVRLARKHISLPSTAPLERRNLSFLAAKSLEKLGRYDDAFAMYTQANRLLPKRFDRDAFTAEIDALIETFSAEALAKLPRATNTSRRPVFIVGLPRSGTTLLEQIIDAHPSAAGVGEVTDIEDIAEVLPQRCPGKAAYPACLRKATPQILTDAANQYLRRMHRITDAAARVVNKNLFNWQHLGLLSLLFPQGYFLDCRRDPVDTCASCYMSELMLGKLPYTANLDDLAFAYGQYERLMAHWHSVLEVKLLRVRYEDVVADLPTRAREIIAFVDLEWDHACERFHESKRMVMTLSYEQVQQPIYSSSVGRAEKFGEHFAPLRAALSKYAPQA